MTGPGDHHEDDAVLAAEHVLGLLGGEDLDRAERRLETDPDYRALYAAWAEDFVSLTHDMTPVTPPVRVRNAIDRRLFGARREGLLRRLGLWPALSAAALAAGTYLVVTNLDLLRPGPEAPPFGAEIAADDRSLVVRVAFDPDAPEMLHVLRPSGAAVPGRALELWLIAGDAAPVSLGVLPEDREGRVTVPEDLQPLLSQAVLAISDEPAGGSPTGAPPGAVLGAGPVTRL
ncbi:anti-sigma factor [Limimaricola soesokkakensis]|uniref:anti-sigma factor n=1 Tax=Limimaricola soesokkakensis TaxID=1343159 RepID=UPI0035114671